MTIQQMEYIVALDNYRHFVKAAQSCGVSQSTLSTLLKKLEEELDVVIFDRESYPMKPTEVGKEIIAQARVVLYNINQLKQITLTQRDSVSGTVKLAVISTVASYIVPKLFANLNRLSPEIHPNIIELQTDEIIEKLCRAEIEMAIMATPLNNSNLLEIPLYYERLVAYISPCDPMYDREVIDSADLPSERLWMLKDGHCLRDQVANLCDKKSGHNACFEAGSIDTLINIVDENGGYTVIPELHIALLNDNQQRNIRPLVSPEPVREISLVIRHDYVRERLLNVISSAIRSFIPEHMVDTRLKKFAIRL